MTDLPPPVNHIFVDYENVQAIDPAIIGSKTVHITLLLGARQTKLDVLLVEKLLRHAATVELIRLQSSGRNALDFTLAYYIGRAVAADPAGYFHIISKDTGYDPLIEHVWSKHICIQRHNDFTTLTFSIPTKPPAIIPKPAPPPAVSKTKSPPKPKVPASDKAVAEDLDNRIVEHLRKHPDTRPRTKKKLVSFLIAYLGHKITEGEVLTLIENLGQAGHLFIDDKDKVTYHLEPM